VFEKYYQFLKERAECMNLTSINGAEDTARLHFLDSLALLKAAPFTGTRVIDIGSGAGFPGVPLKIAEPSIDLTLLDATGKKVAFLSELCDTLNIKALCIHARAEDIASEQDMRERYDIAVSRAVARLNALCELCLPFVQTGGLFIAMKGIATEDEIDDAGSAMVILGAELQECFDYTVPGTDVTHRAVLIRKLSATPGKYPRRFSKISKSPL
jgi:16S rRNA (guanine527-N7)-methyltransferase